MKHLTEKDRYYIELELKKKTPVKEIARTLGKSRQAVYAEIKKGTVIQRNPATWKDEPVYLSDYAQMKHKEAMKTTGRKKKYQPDAEPIKEIISLIRDKKYSPEAAISKSGTRFCTKTFYNYIHSGYIGVTVHDLPYARIKRKKHRPAKKRKYHKGGRSIEERAESILTREDFGHWEMDTVYSSKDDKTALLVLSERKTRHELVLKTKDRTSESILKALNRLEKKLGAPAFREIFKTITCDNGVEFSDSESIEKSCINKTMKRTELYYCHPYSSWERGTNENINRMIRRHIPKGDDIGLYTDREIKEINRWINEYPRKILGGKSSKEYMSIPALEKLYA